MPRYRQQRCSSIFLIVFMACFPSLANAAERPTQINVAYFKQWPAPVQFAQSKQTFDRVLGLKVNWLPYYSGQQMTAALAAGEVQIAYSIGHVPFLVGVNAGLELSIVGVAVSYPDNDKCILRADAGISRDNASSLHGKRIAVRLGSVSHFRLLKVLTHLGVDQSKLKIVPVRDAHAAQQALQRGDVVMACAHGASLRSMAELGKPLLSGAELEAIGLRLFDVIAVATSFAQQYPDIIKAFLQVTDAANQQWSLNPDSMRKSIARTAEMDRGSANHVLSQFHFPLAEEQKTDAWMGAGVSAYSAELARFFVSRGQLDKSLDSYDRFVTTRFLP